MELCGRTLLYNTKWADVHARNGAVWDVRAQVPQPNIASGGFRLLAGHRGWGYGSRFLLAGDTSGRAFVYTNEDSSIENEDSSIEKR